MAAISPQGHIGPITTLRSNDDLEALRAEVPSEYVLAVADTVDDLLNLSRRVQLGIKEEERRAKRRAQQKASRKKNRPT